jgi:hypothetical protein
LCSSTLEGHFSNQRHDQIPHKSPTICDEGCFITVLWGNSIWWYPKNPSKNEYLATLSQTLSVKGNEYVFFFWQYLVYKHYKNAWFIKPYNLTKWSFLIPKHIHFDSKFKCQMTCVVFN